MSAGTSIQDPESWLELETARGLPEVVEYSKEWKDLLLKIKR